MELHIFNGDCTRQAWQNAGETGATLVWRENYLEGALPGTDVPLAKFEAIRAEELHRRMPELDLDKLFAALRDMDRTVIGLSAGDCAYLWFDGCMYDQIMLARILFLLNDTSATVFLICEDIAWGSFKGSFAEKKSKALRLEPDDIARYAAAWEAIVEGEETIRQLPQGNTPERFPFLAKALARYLEEFPGADNLGRSERQLLEIIRSGKHDADEIFQAFGKYEELPFMGDTMCWRMLDSLAERGALTIRTENGRNTYHSK